MKLVALSGSLRPNAFSTAALRAGLEIARHAGAETELCDLREIDLPIFMPDVAILAYPNPARERIASLVARYREADAMLWATPTYHGTMSGALKNALDYMQLLATDPLPYLQGKPVGLISIAAAPAPSRAKHHLRRPDTGRPRTAERPFADLRSLDLTAQNLSFGRVLPWGHRCDRIDVRGVKGCMESRGDRDRRVCALQLQDWHNLPILV